MPDSLIFILWTETPLVSPIHSIEKEPPKLSINSGLKFLRVAPCEPGESRSSHLRLGDCVSVRGLTRRNDRD